VRTFLTNVPSVPQEAKGWRAFCTEANPALFTSGPPARVNDNDSDASSLEVTDDESYRREQGEQAIELVEHLLHPDCTARYTPKQALDHVWLREEEDDDEFVPHLPSKGICARFHMLDECGQHMVYLEDNSIRSLVAGEGIAIGRNPCEFHVNMVDPFSPSREQHEPTSPEAPLSNEQSP
jgi:cell division control protein 7